MKKTPESQSKIDNQHNIVVSNEQAEVNTAICPNKSLNFQEKIKNYLNFKSRRKVNRLLSGNQSQECFRLPDNGVTSSKVRKRK